MDGILAKIGVDKGPNFNSRLAGYFGARTDTQLRAIGLRRADEQYLRIGEGSRRYRANRRIHRSPEAAKEEIEMWVAGENRRWRRWVDALFED